MTLSQPDLSNSPTAPLYRIRSLLFDPRLPHNLNSFPLLRRQLDIILDSLQLVEQHLDGTPVSAPNQTYLRSQLEGFRVKLQHILDVICLYYDTLRQTDIRLLWCLVYASSSDLQVMLEMTHKIFEDVERVCRGPAMTALRSAARLDPQLGSQSTLTVYKMGEPISRETTSASTTTTCTSAEIAALPSPFVSNVDQEKIILVMGPTGAGKSTFINIATGRGEAEVSHSLDPCTQGLQSISCIRNGQRFVFVDTPGFDETSTRDADILLSISKWLNTVHKQGKSLSGILYLHRLSDNRVGGAPLKNTLLFSKLCGKEALRNVVIVGTMGEGLNESTRECRLSGLRQYWKAVLPESPRVIAFDNDHQTAWDIIDTSIGFPRLLQLSVEMINQGKSLAETAVGKFLLSWLDLIIRRIKNLLRRLEVQLSSRSMAQERRNLNNTLQAVTTQLDRLRSSSRKGLHSISVRVMGRSRTKVPTVALTLDPDSRLTDTHRLIIISQLSTRLQQSIDLEQEIPVPCIHPSLQYASEILKVVQTSKSSLNHASIRLLQDLNTLFAAVMERSTTEDVGCNYMREIWNHLAETLGQTKLSIVQLVSSDSAELAQYKDIAVCRKIVVEARDILEIDIGFHAFT